MYVHTDIHITTFTLTEKLPQHLPIFQSAFLCLQYLILKALSILFIPICNFLEPISSEVWYS